MIPSEPQSGEFTGDEKKRLFMTLDANTDLTKKIERGVYGDPDNGVMGFDARLRAIEQKFDNRLTIVENFILKLKFRMAFVSGVTALLTLEGKALWEWITNKHG